MENSQLVHIWANRESENKRCGNLSIRSGELFSYQKIIGKHFDGFTIIQDSKYMSHTTSTHISLAHRACSHLTTYSASNLSSIARNSIDEIAKVLFEEYLDKIHNALLKLSRARKYIATTFSEIRLMAGDACQLFNLTGYESNEQYSWLVTLRHSNNASYILSDDSYLLEQLQLRYKLDLLAKINREQELADIESEAYKLASIARIEQQKEKIKDWRAGIFNGNLFELPVMLRLSGEEIETSHGARVPLNEAKKMYSKYLLGEKLAGYKVGHFLCSSLENEIIKIGCHSIPMGEVRELFAGLIVSDLTSTQH